MKKLAKMAIAAAISGIALAAQASIVIDDFSVAGTINPLKDITTGDGGLWTSTNASGSSNTIIGGLQGGFGYRDMYVEKTGAVASNGISGVGMTVVAGELGYSQDAGDSGIGIIRWDGVNTGALLDPIGLRNGGATGIDLTQGGIGFNIEVVSADAGFPFQLMAFTDATNFSIIQLTSLAGPNSYTIPFAAFALGVQGPGGGADFSNIGALQVVINPGGTIKDLDMRITLAEVPEPGTMALAGLALLGLGAVRRRKLQA